MDRNVAFLLHVDQEPALLRSNARAGILDSQSLGFLNTLICGMYNYRVLYVNTVKDAQLKRKKSGVYKTLEEAQADPQFEDWTWVFFDPKASKGLADYQHPKNKVIYVFGPDTYGFDKPIEEFPGDVLYINSSEANDTEHFAMPCAATVAVHRFYQVGDVEEDESPTVDEESGGGYDSSFDITDALLEQDDLEIDLDFEAPADGLG